MVKEYQFKTSGCNYVSTYMDSMATTNQEHTMDTQKQKLMNSSIPLRKIIKPQGKQQKEELNKEELQNEP